MLYINPKWVQTKEKLPGQVGLELSLGTSGLNSSNSGVSLLSRIPTGLPRLLRPLPVPRSLEELLSISERGDFP